MIKSSLSWQLSVGCEVFSTQQPEAGEKRDSLSLQSVLNESSGIN